MVETAQHISGMTKGPCRHKETWWWNEEVAEAVREKKTKVQKMVVRKFEGGMEHGWSIRSVGRVQRKRNRRMCK